ncbi:beta propeller domain-containing protein [Stackebrandtia albiflava]|uniref:Beta propeller domain-containing protein n=1 Tax=Stackebrandtia albiflava TaxID=406432 RepID=A0A562V1M1_9ACTN|nr:beta-propeller domain-containing protein [Stackebrandtia albiflava]TWJ11809.1 beta propeller domain-containing protein [Stackebrandtia albiflava]
MNKPPTLTRAALLVTVPALLAAGCTGSPTDGTDTGRDTGAPVLTGALESFDDCDTALTELRAATTAHLPALYPDDVMVPFGAQEDAGGDAADTAKAAAPGDGEDFSGTNVQEQGVDEPDLVKTDGRRIVTYRDGVLYVADAAARAVTGSLRLSDDSWGTADLLLHGDRVLVVVPEAPHITLREDTETGETAYGTTLLLVDIAGEPTLVNRFEFDGSYLDARSIDGVARVVVRSAPDIPLEAYGSVDRAAAVERAEISAWLPDYSVDGRTGEIACDALARPSHYSGTSMLTVLTFDLADSLDDGSPVTVAADGQTVYGAADALYIANDRRMFATTDWARPAEAETELYRFDLSGAGHPAYTGSGVVPGFLLNQYSMSQWDGHLRVATTRWDPDSLGSSAVYVLDLEGDLDRVGEVTGLGPGEQIYAVRFSGGTGYVVTFRQVDPLYILDLRNPAAPEATGELKITGYSAYLHPLSDDRLLGIGQEADLDGVTTGTQISLFDVGDPTAPTRLDQLHLPDTYSTAETDPHAFLWWPPESLLAIPVQDYQGSPGAALLVEVSGDTLTRLAEVTHPQSDDWTGVERTLVIGDTLWTVSATGLQASDLHDHTVLEWLPLTA